MSKECPDCYTENPDDALFCLNCNYSFTDLAMDEDQEDKKQDYKIFVWKVRCPVDGRVFQVSDSDYTCDSCQYSEERGFFDPSDCAPYRVKIEVQIPSESEATHPMMVLEEIESELDENCIATPIGEVIKKTYKPIIIEKNGLIGRSGNIETDYFSKDEWISEEHCAVMLRDTGWFVEQRSKSNPTCIDFIELCPRVRTKVHDGSLLQIADKLFSISLRGMSKTSIEEANDYRWIITCPRCGRKYIVQEMNDTIEQCEYCDVFDKNDIANERAVKTYAN